MNRRLATTGLAALAALGLAGCGYCKADIGTAISYTRPPATTTTVPACHTTRQVDYCQDPSGCGSVAYGDPTGFHNSCDPDQPPPPTTTVPGPHIEICPPYCGPTEGS